MFKLAFLDFPFTPKHLNDRNLLPSPLLIDRLQKCDDDSPLLVAVACTWIDTAGLLFGCSNLQVFLFLFKIIE